MSTVAVLFERSGSVSVVVAFALFVISPVVAGAVTAMSTVATSNARIVARLQVTVPVGGAQLPWLDVTIPAVTPGGSVSVMTTPAASSGPSLTIVTW